MKLIQATVIDIVVVWICFYPVNKQKSITIQAPLLEVYNQLHNAENWRKWNTDLKYAGVANEKQSDNENGFTILTPSKTIQVTFQDALTFDVNNGHQHYDITLLPQKYDKSTTLRINYRSGFLYSLLSEQSDKSLKNTSVFELKKYMEEPLSYYGADLKKITLKDLNMMVYRAEVDSSDLFTEMAKSLKAINNAVPNNAVTEMNKIYLQIIPLNKNVIMLVGVPVKKELSQSGGLTYMHIPAQKALIASYNGRYCERKSVYAGLDAYLHDHALKSVMQPIEVYPASGLPLADTSKVGMQIIFSAY